MSNTGKLFKMGGDFFSFFLFFFLFGVIYLEKNKLVFGAIVLKNDKRENDKQVSTIRTSNAESSWTVHVQRRRCTDPQFLFWMCVDL